MLNRERIRQSLAVGVLLLILAAAITTGCGDDDGGPAAPGNQATLSTDEMVAFVTAQAALPLRLADAAARAATAMAGGSQDGVSITTTDDVTYTGTVDVDLDGDGSRETRLGGSATLTQLFDKEGLLAPAATVGFDSASGPYVNSVAGGVMVEVIGGGDDNNPILYVHSAAASLGTTDGIGVGCDDMHMTVDLTFPQAPQYAGYFAFTAGGLDLECSFEENGQGGWQMHLTGDGLDEVIQP
ncbi:MAG: hypothetical protein R3D98_03990 [Candidatus Krumholzibacteriia bacterium]